MKTKYAVEFEKMQIVEVAKQKSIPAIKPGMHLEIVLNIGEDGSTRLQKFEGVCISYKKNGISTSVVIRKQSGKSFVEKEVKLYSPFVISVKIVRYGKVRRAKLYYLRDFVGKKARIREDFIASRQAAALAAEDLKSK
jgi:large subunit ribosomal protein L19